MPKTQQTLLYRWFNEVWNHENEPLIEELMTDDAIVHDLGTDGAPRGAEGFKLFYRGFREQFRDINIEVTEAVAQENFETARCIVQATDRSSNTPVTFTGICMVRTEGGKIAEAWNEFNFLSMYQQLGLSLHQPESVVE